MESGSWVWQRPKFFHWSQTWKIRIIRSGTIWRHISFPRHVGSGQRFGNTKSRWFRQDRAGVVRVGNRDMYLIPPAKVKARDSSIHNLSHRSTSRKAGLRPQSSATCQEFRTYILLFDLDWPTSLSGWSFDIIWWCYIWRFKRVAWLRSCSSHYWKNSLVFFSDLADDFLKKSRNREMFSWLSQGRRLRKKWPRQFCCTFPCLFLASCPCFLGEILVTVVVAVWVGKCWKLGKARLKASQSTRCIVKFVWNWCHRLSLTETWFNISNRLLVFTCRCCFGLPEGERCVFGDSWCFTTGRSGLAKFADMLRQLRTAKRINKLINCWKTN